jgi:heme-degrading monooxygenase HmoA
MAFVVINSVRTSAEDLSRILADVQALGFDTLRAQPGFKSARLLKAEDQTEARLIVEWESRDHFVAYRQSPAGRNAVEHMTALHPQIGFYEVVVGLDKPATA